MGGHLPQDAGSKQWVGRPMSEVSDAARRLKILRDQAGLTMRAVSESLGWSLTRYQHYEDRFKRKFLPFELARALDLLFAQHGIAAGEVLALAGVSQAQSAPSRLVGAKGPASAHSIAANYDLPVLGELRDVADDFTFNSAAPKAFVERPGHLKGAANAFALYVVGEAMEPRFYAGELVFVDPNRPLTRHCFVAIEMADGRGLIRQFVRRGESEAIVRQFNPDKQAHLKPVDVRRMCRIVGSMET
jgi:SOS-response transcriptional repressor LexA